MFNTLVLTKPLKDGPCETTAASYQQKSTVGPPSPYSGTKIYLIKVCRNDTIFLGVLPHPLSFATNILVRCNKGVGLIIQLTACQAVLLPIDNEVAQDKRRDLYKSREGKADVSVLSQVTSTHG